MSPRLINGCQPGEYRNRRSWQPRHPWPDAAPMQFTESERHGTAFIEVFLDRPDPAYLRMDGATLEEVEDRAWAYLQRWRACDHDFVRRDGGQMGSIDTCGRCTRCGGVQTDLFLPLTFCAECGVQGATRQDRTDRYLCDVHVHPDVLPRALWRQSQWWAYMEQIQHQPLAQLGELAYEVQQFLTVPFWRPSDIPSEFDLMDAKYGLRRGGSR
ncbi:hypothetical protein [Deinococcus soli (ex Cha et al. 2016)]|uniref:hypothetical protein n=2 Tax=Deinococcus soli (ex Cha et al. 2016) TaxID=1309411 RepID=UPI001663B8F1|nr:hypothetical protein [Deinococcus soli (ex Cha et al. 2016)]GGB68786.1 hypothetical protein GCM10008019_26250 [Deinococcus soli (ex Cha et al. 2016)]